MQKKLLKVYILLIGKLARFFINKRKLINIGVTGSVGKTSCRMIIYQTLQKTLPNQKIYTSPKNFNGEIGTALAIFEIEEFGPNPRLFAKSLAIIIYKCIFCKPNYDIILIEYGIDHVGEMDLQLSIAVPDISIRTGVDLVHASNYDYPEQIPAEKSKLPLAAKKIVYLNQNDKYCLELVNKIKVDLFMFDTSDGSLDKPSSIYINHNLTGSHNISYINIGASISEILKFQLGYKDNIIHYDIDYGLQSGRYGILNGINQSIIIDSTYNASPKSMMVTIKQVIDDYKNFDGKYILVLGEMRELGKDSKNQHIELMQYIYNLGINNLEKLILISGDMQFAADEANKLGLPYIYQGDSLTTGKRLKDYLNKNIHIKYVILFKSSQGQIYLEEAIKHILLDKADITKLCRQDNEWQKIKKRQKKIN